MNKEATGLVKGLGLLDATTLVMGSMIGSGIFIVSADIARQVQSPGLLIMTWVVTAVLTIIAALSYGELAAAMPMPAANTSTCAKPLARSSDFFTAGHCS
ncbi:MAG: amino acid permease [Bryobacteraceae bacterium]